MIITYADTDNLQPSDFKLHRENGLGDYLFVLFKSPSKVMVDGSYHNSGIGKCIFFDKNTLQSYYPDENFEFLHDFIHLDLESDYEKMLFSDIPKNKLINISLPDVITDILKEIKNELNSSFQAYKKDILTHLGTVFLYRIKNELHLGDIGDKKKPFFNTLYKLRIDIYRTPNTDWSIDTICKRICISRSHFQHLYKEFFSVSCIDDVINARITLAKSLLLSCDLMISEISEKCGYSSTEHFIRQFKKVTGMSPQKFRYR